MTLSEKLPVIECKPPDEELILLKQKYGNPVIRNIDRKDTSEIFLPPNTDYLNCIGEGVGLVFDDDNKYLLVKKANKDSWYFPSGRIWKGESIEDGTIREVLEETGLKAELDSLSSIQIIDLYFINCILRLWHFNFIIKNYSDKVSIQDTKEIGECKFFSVPPDKNTDFDKEWIRITLEDV